MAAGSHLGALVRPAPPGDDGSAGRDPDADSGGLGITPLRRAELGALVVDRVHMLFARVAVAFAAVDPVRVIHRGAAALDEAFRHSGLARPALARLLPPRHLLP